MPEGRLEKLLEKRTTLENRIRQEQSRLRKRAHKDDTRRKILAGAAVLSEAEERPEYQAALLKLLGRFLTRPDDRALFGLPPAAPEKSAVEALGAPEAGHEVAASGGQQAHSASL